MAAIRNTTLIKRFTDFFKLKTGDMLDGDVTPLIVPTVNIQIPSGLMRVAQANLSDGLTGTILTTSLTADTFLVGMSISTAKSVDATSLFSSISGFLFGRPVAVLLRQRYEPLTAGQFYTDFAFPVPVLLARGTIVTLTHSTATASIDSSGFIYFYEVED